MRIAKESWIIAIVGGLDLFSTVQLVREHGASEANPLFASYLAFGLLAFIAAKAACTLGPIVILEWARQHRPRLVQYASRGVIVAYIMMYGIGVANLNKTDANAVGTAYLAPPTYSELHHRR